jgi:uncharacterized protein
MIAPDGSYSELHVGNQPEAGESLQAVAKAGCWFGARLKHRDSFALVGCTVAPGFEFEDFELAKRADLARMYPQHKKLIDELTRA